MWLSVGGERSSLSNIHATETHPTSLVEHFYASNVIWTHSTEFVTIYQKSKAYMGSESLQDDSGISLRKSIWLPNRRFLSSRENWCYLYFLLSIHQWTIGDYMKVEFLKPDLLYQLLLDNNFVFSSFFPCFFLFSPALVSRKVLNGAYYYLYRLCSAQEAFFTVLSICYLSE